MAYFINGLAQALRDQNMGLDVREVAGWKTRGFAGRGITKIVGTMWHHTATGRSAFNISPHPTLNMVTHGRAGLAGPLCTILFDRNGTVWIVAAGWANHAGTGKWTDIPWHRGNDHTVGIEMESSGIYPWDWTPAQLHWAPILGAALRNIFAHENDPSHAEYSDAGKIDQAGWPGGWDGLRQQITEVQRRKVVPAAGPSAPTPIQEEEDPMPETSPERYYQNQPITKGQWQNVRINDKGHVSLISGHNADVFSTSVRLWLTGVPTNGGAKARLVCHDVEGQDTVVEDYGTVEIHGTGGGESAHLTANGPLGQHRHRIRIQVFSYDDNVSVSSVRADTLYWK